MDIRFTLNGAPKSISIDPDRTLLWVLRSELGLTGCKYGCGEGYCGACTVVVNGVAVRSCQYAIKNVAGRDVLTIEGLARDGKLHPIQKAFVQHDALQCGFCTPGMILSAYGFLLKNHKPKREEILTAMEGNICRCSSYVRIVAAIEAAAQEMYGGAQS